DPTPGTIPLPARLTRHGSFQGPVNMLKSEREKREPESLQDLIDRIEHCRNTRGCGHPPCGDHAAGKPTHQVCPASRIVVIGETPATAGWWLTGRAFYARGADGE